MDFNTPNIQQLGSIGGGSSQGPANTYVRYNKQTKKQVYNLRVGEIVQGTIVEVHSDSIVSVQLPIGTFSAELHGRLKSGDQLFFKVQETDPSLVLKIYACSSNIGGRSVQTEELIRMLDIPAGPFYIKLADFLKTRKSIIHRDDFLIYYRSYKSLSDNFLRVSNVDSIFNTLFMMSEARIPLESSNAEKLLPILSNENEFISNLEQIRDLRNFLPEVIKNRIGEILITMTNNDIFVNLKYFLTSNRTNNNSFFQVLQEIENIPATGDIIQKLSYSSTYLLQVIEAQGRYNSYAIRNNSDMVFIAPIFDNNFKYLKIYVKSFGVNKEGKQLLQISLFSDAENLTSLLMANENMEIFSNFNEKDKIKAHIYQHKNLFSDIVGLRDFIIQTVNFNKSTSNILQTSALPKDNKNGRFSVVV